VWQSSGAWPKIPPCLIPLAALIPQNPQRFHAVTVAERVHVDGWLTNATHASERPYPLDWVPGLSGMPEHRGREPFERETNPGGTNPKQMMCFY
jgi:hypothetical protein